MLEPLNLSSVEGAGSRDHVLAGADQRTFYRSGALQYRWSRFDFITSSEYMPNSYGFFFVFSTTTTITFSVVLHLFGGGGFKGYPRRNYTNWKNSTPTVRVEGSFFLWGMLTTRDFELAVRVRDNEYGKHILSHSPSPFLITIIIRCCV